MIMKRILPIALLLMTACAPKEKTIDFPLVEASNTSSLVIEKVEMTDSEFNKYRFKPKLLAYDLYGSTELYFTILFLNGICSIKDFNRKNIRLIKKSDMILLLESIYNAEQNYLSTNRASINYIE